MTLTFNPILPGVKVNLHAKNQGRRSNGLAMRAQTDRRTDTQTDTHTGPIILPFSANVGGNNIVGEGDDVPCKYPLVASIIQVLSLSGIEHKVECLKNKEIFDLGGRGGSMFGRH